MYISPFRGSFPRRCAQPFSRLSLSGFMLVAGAAQSFAAEIDSGRAPRAPLARLAGTLELGVVILVALLFKTGLVGAASLAHRLRPSLPAAAGIRLGQRPFAMFLLGLLDLALLIVALAFFKLSNDLRLLVLAAALPPLAVGAAGLYALAGEREGSADRAAAILRGGILIETATLIPLAGQFFQAIMLIASLGAGVLTLLDSRKPAAPAAPQPPAGSEPPPVQQ